jgi:hypothetical protein
MKPFGLKPGSVRKSLELDADSDPYVRTTGLLRGKGTPGKQRLEHLLDIALEDTFPCSDPVSLCFDR